MLINVPTKQQRLEILKVLMADLNVASDVSLPELATCTVGFVGADLQALCAEAESIADGHMESNVKNLTVICLQFFTLTIWCIYLKETGIYLCFSHTRDDHKVLGHIFFHRNM